jgi:hypothetical protein
MCEIRVMNIVNTEVPSFVIAKTCNCKQIDGRQRKVAYTFMDHCYSVCVDRREIVLAELQACEKLLKFAMDYNDKSAIKMEIEELKLELDLMSQ